MWLHTHVAVSFFFFNDTATTEIYTLSLHDALPIYGISHAIIYKTDHGVMTFFRSKMIKASNLIVTDTKVGVSLKDRKSTRLNSSHANISYAVFCLKKKIKKLNLTILLTPH